MKSFNSFISESKKCPEGKYWCFTSKKCKKIPNGWYVTRSGNLEKEKEDEYEVESDSGGDGGGE